MMPHHHRADGIMQNTNDWETTLAGLALAVAAIGKEHEPTEILEGMARALALVGKALAEDGDEEQQAAILEHIQGALVPRVGRVSIRAPVRGRPMTLTRQSWHSCFNPRPREGATCPGALQAPAWEFQSAPP